MGMGWDEAQRLTALYMPDSYCGTNIGNHDEWLLGAYEAALEGTVRYAKHTGLAERALNETRQLLAPTLHTGLVSFAHPCWGGIFNQLFELCRLHGGVDDVREARYDSFRFFEYLNS